MAKAKVVKLLIVTTPDEIGTLGKVSTSLSDAGVDISHLCAYGEGGKASFMIIASDPGNATRVLKGIGYEVSQEDALEVEFENAPGTLSPVAKKLGDAGVNIKYIYGTTGDGSKVIGVMSTADNQKALSIING